MKLIEICAECGKPLELKFETKNTEVYKCGHSAPKSAPKKTISALDFTSLDGTKSAYEYQKEGVEFISRAGGNALIADAMGLGKTIQALLWLKNYPEEGLPCLIIQKSATTGNWIKEISIWLSAEPNAGFAISGKMPFIPAGFQTYVISMDSLEMNEKQLKQLHKLCPFKSVIVDECHSFKNDGTKRTKSLIKFLSGRDDTDNRGVRDNHFTTGNYEVNFQPITKRIFLSGTPIKNRADEYFVSLNLLRQRHFPSRQQFRRGYLSTDLKGNYTSISPYRLDRFREHTMDFVLRREKSEVLLNLPPFSRHYEFITIENQHLKHLYNKELDLMDNMLKNTKMSNISLLGWLAHMRHITGVAKIPAAVDFTKEFFETCELEKQIDNKYPDKLAIGIHHKGVRLELLKAFSDTQYPALSLSGEDNAIKKDQIVEAFSKPENKVLVANELAGGVGLNMQACANTLILERQWNSADEEQWESRFHRNGQQYPVTATYLIADKTIDQFFHNMVEEKRKIFGSTVQFNLATDEDSLRNLVDQTLGSRL